MTKAQYKRYNQLRNKQVNRDVTVVETSESSVTFYVPFPGLYLTYGRVGELLLSETEAERKAGPKPVSGNKVMLGEMGSDLLGLEPRNPPPCEDDDVPF